MLAEVVINSDSHGNPNNAGGHLHVCVVSDRPIPRVGQMTLPFGALDNVSCAIAATLAVGLMFNEVASPATVLADLHTSFATNGTQGQYIPPTLQEVFGLASHWANGQTLPPTLYWMNPAWAGLFTPGQSGPYVAAMTGDVLFVDTPLPSAQPSPQPVISEEYEAMQVAMWDPVKAPWQGNQVWAWVDGKGDLRERWAWPGQPSGEATLATGCEPNADVGLLIDAGRRTVHLNVKMADGSVLHLFESGGDPWGRDQFS